MGVVWVWSSGVWGMGAPRKEEGGGGQGPSHNLLPTHHVTAQSKTSDEAKFKHPPHHKSKATLQCIAKGKKKDAKTCGGVQALAIQDPPPQTPTTTTHTHNLSAQTPLTHHIYRTRRLGTDSLLLHAWRGRFPPTPSGHHRLPPPPPLRPPPLRLLLLLPRTLLPCQQQQQQQQR